jgi:hypothetical protein
VGSKLELTVVTEDRTSRGVNVEPVVERGPDGMEQLRIIVNDMVSASLVQGGSIKTTFGEMGVRRPPRSR